MPGKAYPITKLADGFKANDLRISLLQKKISLSEAKDADILICLRLAAVDATVILWESVLVRKLLYRILHRANPKRSIKRYYNKL